MPVVGSYCLDQVPVQWDNHPSVRERIRDNNSLVLAFDYETGKPTSKYVDATVDNLKLNSPVVMPLATLMRENDLQIPAIEKLTGAVADFFQLAKLSRSDDHAYQEAWALRRLVGKLKRFTYRSTPPQDPLGLKIEGHATDGILSHLCANHPMIHNNSCNDREHNISS